MLPEPNSAGRLTCYTCFRPASACLCPSIPRIDNRTQVAVLQHPRERTHPFGTARLAELGLRRVEVIVDHERRVRSDPTLLGPLSGTALLYPSARARDLTTLSPAERPRRLLVIDGTWHHARTLYRDIPALAELPHLTLPGHLRSAFQIRRQPQVHCLSTIEAIVFALSTLEPETAGLEGLLAAFMAMQSAQLAKIGKAGRRRKDTRARETRGISRSLVEGYEDLIVAYVESGEDESAPAGRSLLCCAAERIATGERFQRVLRVPGVSDAQLERLGLRREQVDQGLSLAEFRADWARFAGPTASLAAWNHGTLALLGSLSQREASSRVALKSIYLNLKRHRGSLEQIVTLERLAPRAAVAGEPMTRAERRLDHALRLTEFLHQRACPITSAPP